MTKKALITIPVAMVRGMLAGIEARGESCESYLADVGIPMELLSHPRGRVTAEQYVALFRFLIERRGDECLGFLSRPLKPGSFALMARSALGSRDVRQAILRIARTFALLRDDATLELCCEDDNAGMVLSFDETSVVHHVFLHELLLRVFWRLVAWLAGGRLPARRFDFAFDTPAHVGSYSQAFPAQLEFGQPHTALWFDAHWLEVAVHRDEDALRAFLAEAPANIIMPRRNDEMTSKRVRNHLRHTQPNWPDLASAASTLNVSTATLQRRLALEGTSFQALKDELRRDIAIVRLSTSAAPLAQLAHELGFTDSAAFQRAFKGWTGSSPGAYRKGEAVR
ncbi:AraC family transcriptional regulator [Variovorax sp. J22R24]|uniref:AraC family transcriptional regulator n=1 Tax=Variovorax gracilis TaxID=3053502 RepID=UPI002578243A|nr:AraC family transcriptional regulator [Variovorax sp. J22R24]MDM0109702.1 AraC family transcriptional regulator [Variovorax sp. J22R24]